MTTRKLDLPEWAMDKIEDERRRLNKASAILQSAVVAAQEGVDEDTVADAVSAARELIDAAVDALDAVELSRAGRAGAA